MKPVLQSVTSVSRLKQSASLLGQMLLKRGWIKKGQLNQALAEQAYSGSLLGQILLRRRSITSQQLYRCLAAQRTLRTAALLVTLVMSPFHLANACNVNSSPCVSEAKGQYAAMPKWNFRNLSASYSRSQRLKEKQDISDRLQSFVAEHTSPLLVKALRGEHEMGAAANEAGMGYKFKWSDRSLNVKVTYNF